MSLLERWPHFRGWYVQVSMELGPKDVSLLERCPHFRGWYVQASMEFGPEDVSLLERCPHFGGWYVQASMELGPEDVSLLERCPHFPPSSLFRVLNTNQLHVERDLLKLKKTLFIPNFQKKWPVESKLTTKK